LLGRRFGTACLGGGGVHKRFQKNGLSLIRAKTLA
jgi:hypothetical protein